MNTVPFGFRLMKKVSSSFLILIGLFLFNRIFAEPFEEGKSIIQYSTYLGGSAIDVSYAIVVDQDGYIYVAGETASTNFVTKNAVQGHLAVGNCGSSSNTDPCSDSFISKLTPDGRRLVYSTFWGGTGSDIANSIAVDRAGYAYVTGSTSSRNFPLKNPAQRILRGELDAFVLKLDPAGNVVYSTILGGNLGDSGRGIAADAEGNAFVTGVTGSSNFPTLHAIQSKNNGVSDAFITKLSSDGRLVYSTYVGGQLLDVASTIALNKSGEVFIAGSSESSNFPIVNGLQNFVRGNLDAFVMKLNSEGNLILYSTFLGGSSLDDAYSIAVTPAGAAIIGGTTYSTDFPLKNAFQKKIGGNSDAFLAKITPTGKSLVYSTYIGGSQTDFGQAVATDSHGNAYVTGRTKSISFPIRRAFQAKKKLAADAFITKIDRNGVLVSSSFLGGNFYDWGLAITVSSNNAYVTGSTDSTAFPVVNAFQSKKGGDAFDVDSFITHIQFNDQ